MVFRLQGQKVAGSKAYELPTFMNCINLKPYTLLGTIMPCRLSALGTPPPPAPPPPRQKDLDTMIAITIEALIIRIGLGPVGAHDTVITIRNPQNSIGNDLGP